MWGVCGCGGVWVCGCGCVGVGVVQYTVLYSTYYVYVCNKIYNIKNNVCVLIFPSSRLHQMP